MREADLYKRYYAYGFLLVIQSSTS